MVRTRHPHAEIPSKRHCITLQIKFQSRGTPTRAQHGKVHGQTHLSKRRKVKRFPGVATFCWWSRTTRWRHPVGGGGDEDTNERRMTNGTKIGAKTRFREGFRSVVTGYIISEIQDEEIREHREAS
ncbi:hypothetical protein Zmor_025005 [Zophobas morio]|uniref:Uncharacterized protein n=1 Tax=Zophobas morio TaxID=2755281 RepID=A0AA38M364_9CUCU|nr:hypothetical protein Zmor_025005 [Zophobas morio]